MQITPQAKGKLAEFLEDYNDGFVRVARMTKGGSCCATLVLGVTLDEEFDDDNDLRFDLDGLPVVIEKSLNESLENVNIAFADDQGIVVTHKGR